ncbi:YozQ family protein [Pseudoneobacillus sp. C159]
MKNSTPKDNNLDLAGRHYDVSDYQKKDQLSSGLATTHEQVSDAYMEGDSDPLIGDVNGRNIELTSENLKQQP